ncbi:MAG: Uma2 family endonuclease [Gemmatimonadetes bacterium]|nr:Uma2 family endonuclease [Gemmatimonadota bacterium]
MPVVVPRYTLEDLQSFPNDGNRYELLDGVLLVTPAPLPPHQIVLDRLVRALHLYFGTSGKAHICTPGSVEIAPNLHLEPDILVIPEMERIAEKWTEVRTWWLAVEISGRGSRVYDRDHKRTAYIAVGVQEVWRADLAARWIFITRPGSSEERAAEAQLVWQAPQMAHALVLDVASVFEGIEGDE